jgi:hypothetical protein
MSLSCLMRYTLDPARRAGPALTLPHTHSKLLCAAECDRLATTKALSNFARGVAADNQSWITAQFGEHRETRNLLVQRTDVRAAMHVAFPALGVRDVSVSAGAGVVSSPS